MKEFKFYKESDNRWYIDLPEWTGNVCELEMVAGADKMLDYMADGKTKLSLILSVEDFENSNKLEFIELANNIENGAYYKLDTYNGINLNSEMWLCDVTKFVFGKFPETIYFAVV